MSEAVNKRIKSSIKYRANIILRNLVRLCDNKDKSGLTCWIAGGCLNGEINDVDIFHSTKDGLDGFADSVEVITKTKNAITYKNDPWPVQVCSYRKPTLNEMVESFDYAHIQVGVSVNQGIVNDVFFTDAFVSSNAVNSTWFTGSDYPLSSLIRIGKYFKRGEMSRGSYMREVIAIVEAVIRRGFKDYDDFREQLDAVYLEIVPEKLEADSAQSIMGLFDVLRRDKHA